MNIQAFTNPSGRLVPNLDGQVTFLPNPLPPKIDYDAELIALLAEASIHLGRLSGIGQLIKNPRLLINPYLRREAVLSSRIEGTQASLTDLLLYEVTGKKPDEALRIEEVRNYVDTTYYCLEQLQKGKKISLDLIQNAHKRLLYGVRGHDKTPGQFRQVQNWIGPVGCIIDDATFVPPDTRELPGMLSNFEKFLQDTTVAMPQLIQIALIHYQFETIHPFVDGNGRIGRLLITLFFCERKTLSEPLLYLSAYFERNQTDYYRKLLRVSQESEWDGWLKFFLNGVNTMAKEAVENAQSIINLQSSYKEVLYKIKAGKNSIQLCDYLFQNPFITISKAQEYLKVSFPAAQNAIKTLEKADIIKELTGQKTYRYYVATELMRLIEPKSVPLGGYGGRTPP